MQPIDINAIKTMNREKGRFWFTSSTMRFFNSRVSHIAYRIDNKAYFISSEKCEREPRKWTIRFADLITGEIKTFGEFQEFSTYREARKALKQIV